ncbi:unnamed protein product, partial [Mesorhabditis belari]|uniref:Uncharacterized protein n=1 Tax=Mesorhabditis belari TaxID=2138241 RepID=A0AAF3FAE2_9BILA
MFTKSFCQCRHLSTKSPPSKASQKLSSVYGAGLSASGALAIPSLVVNTKIIPPRFVKSPRRISALNFSEITHVASGFGFSLFSSRNKLYGSGLNNYSQITAIETSSGGQDYYISKKHIPLPRGGIIVGIAAGRAHSLVAFKDWVCAFGHNVHGQCGLDPEQQEVVVQSSDPQAASTSLLNETPILDVHCSLDSSFILTTKGEVYAFGLNEDGQCANEEFGIQVNPSKIKGDTTGEEIVAVTGSTDTILAISKKGDLFAWGQNEHHQAGLGNTSLQVTTSCHVPIAKRIVSAGATACSCVALDTDGIVYTWGTQFLGQGPRITKVSQPTPLDQPLFNNKKVVKVFAGNTCAGALNEDGEFFIWGLNRFGQLGIDSEKDQLFPLQIYFPNDVCSASLGTDHSLFLMK